MSEGPSLDRSGLQARLRNIAAERNWERFHTPKNLVMALGVEVAELAEIFQWMTPDESALMDEALWPPSRTSSQTS